MEDTQDAHSWQISLELVGGRDESHLIRVAE